MPRPPADGLSSEEAARRLARGEGNRFVPAVSRSWAGILRANLITRFNALVVGCFGLLLLLGRWQDALFGFTAIANALIGSLQEARAKRTLDRVSLVAAPTARVVRDGAVREVQAADLVRGDSLVLAPGDQLAADATVTACGGLQVDESLLSGESKPVDKGIGDELLSGSLVAAGEGRARVTRVGADSWANRYALEARRFSLVRSELRRGVERVLTWASWAALPIALLVFVSQVNAAGGWRQAFGGDGWREAAVGTIAATIALIPLGLVLMTSVAFAIGAVRLTRHQVLVQELAAVEGLARVDVICLDKTGTLTEGPIGLDAVHPIATDGHPGWRIALAWFASQPDANATARALAPAFPLPDGVPPPTDRTAFASSSRRASVTFASGAVGTWVLGTPSDVVPADPAVLAQAAALAVRGCRVLALAHGTPAAGVALIALRERVRADARATLDYFAREGVEVRVLSGDDPATVASIAREAGLVGAEGVDARSLPVDDTQLADALDDARVLGRVEPEQKQRIIAALQRRGRVVAMTGDGVNDVLALKSADLGIAMGSGAPAARAVARVVLLDGRFSRLPVVVAEGRRVMGNMERISMLFLTKTAYALCLALCFGAAALPFPLLPRQLSVTDGLTIGIPAFLLALLPDTRRYRSGFLRRALTFAIPAGAVVAAAVGGSAVAAGLLGAPEPTVRTGATVVLALSGLVVLTVLSRPLRMATAGIVAAMLLGLVAVLATPIARDFLELRLPAPAGVLGIAVAVAFAAVGMVVVDVLVRWRTQRAQRARP